MQVWPDYTGARVSRIYHLAFAGVEVGSKHTGSTPESIGCNPIHITRQWPIILAGLQFGGLLLELPAPGLAVSLTDKAETYVQKKDYC